MEKIKEAFQDFTDRIKSPFWGSFILIWCYMNWRIIFAFLFVDHSLPLTDQIQIVKDEIDLKDINQLIIYPLLWTAGSLFFYYIAAGLGLLIKELYVYRLKAFILKIASKGAKIVPIDRFRRYQSDLKDERAVKEEFKKMYLEYAGDNVTLRADKEKLEEAAKADKEKIKELEAAIEEDEKRLNQAVHDMMIENAKLQSKLDELGLLDLNYPKLNEVFEEGMWRRELYPSGIPSTSDEFRIEKNIIELKSGENSAFTKSVEIVNLRSFDKGNIIMFTRIVTFFTTAIDAAPNIYETRLVRIADGHYIGNEDGIEVQYERISA